MSNINYFLNKSGVILLWEKVKQTLTEMSYQINTLLPRISKLEQNEIIKIISQDDYKELENKDNNITYLIYKK